MTTGRRGAHFAGAVENHRREQLNLPYAFSRLDESDT